jgi:hypothetical protein
MNPNAIKEEQLNYNNYNPILVHSHSGGSSNNGNTVNRNPHMEPNSNNLMHLQNVPHTLPEPSLTSMFPLKDDLLLTIKFHIRFLKAFKPVTDDDYTMYCECVFMIATLTLYYQPWDMSIISGFIHQVIPNNLSN